jgi:7,8-dihydroneopterin aldolase/epimerase/oxygenase
LAASNLAETAPAASAARIIVTKVFVRGLKVDAQIGVYDHEHGRFQPLVVDVELDVAAEGHVDLVETFAERLAQACFLDHRVTRARVRVEKPLALAPYAAAAGVEITAVRS